MQADVMAGRPRVSSARLAQAGRGLPIFASQHLPFASDCFTAIMPRKARQDRSRPRCLRVLDCITIIIILNSTVDMGE